MHPVNSGRLLPGADVARVAPVDTSDRLRASGHLDLQEVVFVSEAGGGETGGSPLDVNYATGLQNNDYLILLVRAGGVIVTPTGWTLIAETGAMTHGHLSVFGKRSNGTESGTVQVTINFDTPGAHFGIMYDFRGVDPISTTPWESVSTVASSVDPNTAYSDLGVTASGVGRLACNFHTFSNQDTAGVLMTGASGGTWAIASDVGATSVVGGRRFLVHTAPLASGATINGGSAVLSSNGGPQANVGFALIGTGTAPTTASTTTPTIELRGHGRLADSNA